MHASTASMCLRRLSDWVYSQSRLQAWFRSISVRSIIVFYLSSTLVLYLVSPLILPFSTIYSGFYLNFMLTIVSASLKLSKLGASRSTRFLENCLLWRSEIIHGYNIGVS